ncbi:MAG: hypothetical protein ACXWJR_06845 [Xanthobacteraceae bacterium]
MKKLKRLEAVLRNGDIRVSLKLKQRRESMAVIRNIIDNQELGVTIVHLTPR